MLYVEKFWYNIVLITIKFSIIEAV